MSVEAEILAELGTADLGSLQMRRLIRRLARSGEATSASVPVLSGLAASSNLEIGYMALRVLASIDAPEAIDQLRLALHHPEGMMHRWAAMRLRRLGAVDAIPDFLSVLRERRHDLDGTSRAMLITALRGLLFEVPDPTAVDVHIPYLADPDRSVRRDAVRTLAWLGTTEAMMALRLAAIELDAKDQKFIEQRLRDDVRRSPLAEAEHP